MRKIAWALAIAALAVLGLGTSAQAAGSVTTGSSCKVESGLTVNGSATFNNTSGSPSRGQLKYVVMVSPTQLSTGGTYASEWVALNASGSMVSYGYFGLVSSPSEYHYRSIPTGGYLNVAGVASVKVYPQHGANECTMTIKSKN